MPGQKPRAVLDTSVLVAGILQPDGPSGQVMRAFVERRFTHVTSSAILDEMVDVLTREKIRRVTKLDRPEVRFQAAMNEALKCVAKEESDSAPGVYYAQYAGFFRNGHKVVYVNAVGDPVQGWRDRAIALCDGGVMSFGAVLDLDRDAVDSFEFNGTMVGPLKTRSGCFEGAAQHGVAPDGRSPAAPARR